MRITVTRSGGVAGIRRQGRVDTSERTDAETWHRLVDRAGLPHASSPQPAPDRFVYTIDVDEQQFTVGEAEVTATLRELVDRVLAES